MDLVINEVHLHYCLCLIMYLCLSSFFHPVKLIKANLVLITHADLYQMKRTNVNHDMMICNPLLAMKATPYRALMFFSPGALFP